MEKFRTLLYISLALVLFLIWQAWERDYGQLAQPEPAKAVSPQAVPSEDLPTAPAVTGAATAIEGVQRPPIEAPQSKRIHVTTDVFDIEIDTMGGDLRKVDLVKYPVSVDTPDQPFRLMTDEQANLFISQSGLLGDNAPKHTAVYQSTADSYAMRDGEDTLAVTLEWRGENGVKIEKVYTFTRGKYDIDVEYRVHNSGNAAWNGRFYRQLKRAYAERESKFLYTFTGAVVSSPEEPYEKFDFDDMRDKNLARDIKGGWVAMIQHYFIAAWTGDEGQANHVYTKATANDQFVVGMVANPTQVAAGQTATIKAKMFVGPKLQNELEALAPHLELTVDYGWLTVLAKPIYWLMKQIHGLLGNWGWSIIILTLLIKLVFYKLSETSYRSMARMRKMQPRLQQLKERFGDDKQGMQQAMMKLYKEEKINPFGGCLPILIQIPVFIALYWVLLESVELRQAPFVLWIKDLSTPDPYFVLPIVMGVTMILQQKLNPSPLDEMQKKIMMMLPIMFTVFFLFFPAGLVLYWTANNILSIAQQWVITKRVTEGKG
ncbi:MAG: membrane protein insertase YidC [Granulosicoccaceae bacterium]|jgi:YidC/Oxa1 family membrane protein insertase